MNEINQISVRVRALVDIQVSSRQLRSQVWSKVWSQVNSQVGTQANAQVYQPIKNQAGSTP